jgi:phosphatidylinositol alpha-mannosyltransferase
MVVGFVLDDTLDVSDGVQQAVLTTGAEMTRRGHDVHYIVADTLLRDDLQIHSIARFMNLKFNGNSVRTPRPASRKAIQSIFRKVRFDVLYVQMPYSPFLSGKVVSMAPSSVKIFGTFHILPYSKTSYTGTRFLGMILRKSLKRFDGFFAVSKPALTFMRSVFNVDGTVLPNPIDYGRYHAHSKIADSNNKSVVFVGRFDERKGALQLVQAISLLPQKTRNKVSFVMCGKGPLLAQAKSFAELNSLHIEFPGFVTDKQKIKYLSTATIAVFPSISGESFGIVLAEAMAAGSGVTIGGDNPGYKSVLGAWVETLFDARDPRIIADTLLHFLTDSSLRKKIGTEQHAHVLNYDVVKIVDELESKYGCSMQNKES